MNNRIVRHNKMKNKIIGQNKMKNIKYQNSNDNLFKKYIKKT